MRAMGRYDVVPPAVSCFLQMFIWARFPAIALKFMEFLPVTMEEVVLAGGSRGTTPSNAYKPQCGDSSMSSKLQTNLCQK